MATVHHVAAPQLEKVAVSELAVDGKIEHCQLTDTMRDIEPYPDGPDLFELEGVTLVRTPCPCSLARDASEVLGFW